jgi:hypothetical protein
MGFRFRKSVKIGGIRFNLGKNGLTSVSIGKKGHSTNLSKKGVRTTLGIKGTGLSYSTLHKFEVEEPVATKKSFFVRFWSYIFKLSWFAVKYSILFAIIFVVVIYYQRS